jgi:tetratricopeptide (TPR) repeat protein
MRFRDMGFGERSERGPEALARSSIPIVKAFRDAVVTGFVILPLLSGCGFEQPAESPKREPAADAPSAVPSWVPANTPQQAALLAPVERTIKTPAHRVFPILERFGYANNRPLADTADAIKFTRMVTQVLNDSPRFYSLDELPAGAANPIAQYGPPPGAPDGYQLAKRTAQGIGELQPARGADEARAAATHAEEQVTQGDVAGAIETYRAALAKTPTVPALRTALANALLQVGRPQEAEAAYKESIALDPTFAPAHFALGELALKRGDKAGARRELVEGLAYNPPSRRGLELLRRMTSSSAPSADGGWYDTPPADAASQPAGRGDPFPTFIDVDSAGAIHVATGKSDAAQIYGGCRAVMRYEPSVRAQIFQQPRETPYYLSVAEEVVCLEAALGAYVSNKGERNDPELDQLLQVAQGDGLSGYVMFEILGQHRPERARCAPPDVHRDMVAYLEHWVLMLRPKGPAEGVYTAKR